MVKCRKVNINTFSFDFVSLQYVAFLLADLTWNLCSLISASMEKAAACFTEWKLKPTPDNAKVLCSYVHTHTAHISAQAYNARKRSRQDDLGSNGVKRSWGGFQHGPSLDGEVLFKIKPLDFSRRPNSQGMSRVRCCFDTDRNMMVGLVNNPFSGHIFTPEVTDFGVLYTSTTSDEYFEHHIPKLSHMDEKQLADWEIAASVSCMHVLSASASVKKCTDEYAACTRGGKGQQKRVSFRFTPNARRLPSCINSELEDE